MQRSLARKLIALLVLLALIAGGDRFAIAKTMGMHGSQMTEMQKPDMSCKACGGAMTAAPCDALCAALPAIDTPLIGLGDDSFHERWMVRTHSGAGHSIRPDTSPPRS